METTDKVPFASWCVVELFGHQQIAGRVTEQSIGGASFVRVDVPTTGDQEGFTRFFGPGAIYSIIPTTEAIATAYAARNVGAPIQPWQLKQPQLPVPMENDYEGETGDDDDDYSPPF